MTGFPDREPMFDTSLMRGLNQLNMHEIGEELNDQDTRLLASVLGTANTEDATIACSDGDIFSKLLGAIVDAEPEGAGSASVALGLGAKIGTPEGLASLLRHASRILGERRATNCTLGRTRRTPASRTWCVLLWGFNLRPRTPRCHRLRTPKEPCEATAPSKRAISGRSHRIADCRTCSPI